ncbi:MAG: DJ-1/PfpI family protein [Candidatus Aenigmarchaeota archaeon]|nr:DJ-1/PfpI family protein [Candidatus Aenigmarchaeota archaeon]
MVSILIPLAEGFDEIEASTAFNVLKRAGFSVVTAGLAGTIVKGSRGIQFITDQKLDRIRTEEFDALVLVGGEQGYRNLMNSKRVIDLVKRFNSIRKTIASISHAPLVLAKAGILDDRLATIYPGLEKEIPKPRNHRVLADGHIITSRSPGTAIDFSLKIVERLGDRRTADRIRRDLHAE